MLYPTELLGQISEIFNFPPPTDSNELPLRRRSLYTTELQGRMNFYSKIILGHVPGNRGKDMLCWAIGANLSIISDLCCLVNSLLAMVSSIEGAPFCGYSGLYR